MLASHRVQFECGLGLGPTIVFNTYLTMPCLAFVGLMVLPSQVSVQLGYLGARLYT